MPEKQISVISKMSAEFFYYLFLRLLVKINEDVAAENNVKIFSDIIMCIHKIKTLKRGMFPQRGLYADKTVARIFAF